MATFSAVAAVLFMAIVACASSPRPQPHEGLERAWGQFLQAPKQRAMAIAGEPRGLYAAGIVGGHLSQIEAERHAIELCERRRTAQGIPGECQIYAIGHQIVWQEPKTREEE